MIGAPHVDHGREAAAELVEMVGDVGREIGPGAVGAPQRPVDLVAVGRRAEQQLRHGLPVRIGLAALGRRQGARVEQPHLVEHGQRLVDPPRLDQLALRGEYVVAHAQGREVVADQGHHRRHAHALERLEPVLLATVAPAVAVARGDRLRHRLQIVARIEPGGNLADRLAECLPVAQVQRAGERLGLGAAVVDIVLAGDGVAGMRQDAGQGVAEHGPADMADMQRAGRVGRAELDIDALPLPHSAAAVLEASLQDRRHLPLPEGRRHGQVHEARRCRRGLRDVAMRRKQVRQLAGQGQWRAARRLGEHEGGIGGRLAMCRIARRLHRDPVELQLRRQPAARLQLGDRRAHDVQELAERAHVRSRLRRNRRSCSSSAKRSVMPAT